MLQNLGIVDSLLLLGVAILFFLFQPKSKNAIYGYRTFRAKKSKQHWVMANKLASKVLLYCSISILLVSLFIRFGLDKNPKYIFLPLFMVAMIVTFTVVERKLIKYGQSSEKKKEE